MAQPTNAFSVYDAKGTREDLADYIGLVANMQTPFYARAATTKATNTYHEWQTQALATPADNKAAEGDIITSYDSVTATVRLGNYTQISTKSFVITTSEQAVLKAGRADEVAYQAILKGRELQKDIETTLVGTNKARAAGNDSAPTRQMAPVTSWIVTNVSKASDGTNPTGDGTDARTDGTARALTETQLKDVMQSCWNNGGQPKLILCSAANKRIISQFTGNNTRMINMGETKTMSQSIDYYETDFGMLEIIPDAHMRSAFRSSAVSELLVLDMEYWQRPVLVPITMRELAVTGLFEAPRLLFSEHSLACLNEKASGIVADLTA